MTMGIKIGQLLQMNHIRIFRKKTINMFKNSTEDKRNFSPQRYPNESEDTFKPTEKIRCQKNLVYKTLNLLNAFTIFLKTPWLLIDSSYPLFIYFHKNIPINS